MREKAPKSTEKSYSYFDPNVPIFVNVITNDSGGKRQRLTVPLQIFELVYVYLYVCKTAKSVDVRTIDPRKDLQVYCTANKCNNTKKREQVTQMLLKAKHQ